MTVGFRGSRYRDDTCGYGPNEYAVTEASDSVTNNPRSFLAGTITKSLIGDWLGIALTFSPLAVTSAKFPEGSTNAALPFNIAAGKPVRDKSPSSSLLDKAGILRLFIHVRFRRRQVRAKG